MSCAVHVAATLGLADSLAAAPLTAEDLAAADGLHAPSLRRVMRLLVSAGVLSEDETGRFSLTPTGALLRSDGPDSMRSAALLWGGKPQLAWYRLLHCVQKGAPAFPRVFGRDPFSYMSEHRDDADVFDKGMAALTRHTAQAVAAAYDFSRFGLIVDIGGGNGALIANILEAYPSSRGILFDLAHVAERGARSLLERGLSDRTEAVGGDFFSALPAGGDAYIFANVLIDWDNERARVILTNCRQAMGEDSRLLVIEPIYPKRIDASPQSRAATSTDVNVMVCAGGGMRSEAEFRALFAVAGLSVERVVLTASAAVIIEGVKAHAVNS